MPVNEKSFFVAPMLELVFYGCPFAVSQIRSAYIRVHLRFGFLLRVHSRLIFGMGSRDAEPKRVLLVQHDLAFGVYESGSSDGGND